MAKVTRRKFVELVGAAGAGASVAGWPLVAGAGQAKGRVVIVGGGFGGATCAKYLRRFAPQAAIVLVERDTKFVTCPFSNAVLAGMYELDDITQGYDALRDRHGVKVIHDSATAVDPAGRTVTLAGGDVLKYDRLVLSPGIDFQWGAIEGYDEPASARMPHAWKAGPQTLLLRRQLEAMPDGGIVVIAAPRDPFRCPPGPYERASLIAHYLKQAKPRSKILIYDAKGGFSKQPLFEQGWKALYPGMIEWIGEADGGAIERVDADAMTVYPTFGDPQKADVVNIISPQEAGAIAQAAGLTRDGWCPVDQRTFRSELHEDVYVIGDASVANPMPKSGFAASSQGKVCAAAIAAELAGADLPDPSYVNTCYSLIGPEYGISIAAVYRVGAEGIFAVEGAGGVSPADADETFRREEARYTVGWYQSITADIWG